jgi:hypothetical protein
VADRLPGGRLRPGAHRPDDRQRHRRLAHPPLRRRRALRSRHREAHPLRARARHADRRAQPRGRVRDHARPPDAHRLAAARVARAPPPGRDGLRGRRARRERPHRHLIRAGHLRARGGLGRPTPWQGLRREGARAGRGACARPPRGAGAGDAHQRAGARVRDGARDRVRLARDGADQRRGRRRPARRPGRARAGRAAAAVEVRRLPLGRAGSRRGPRRARRSHARPCGARRLRHDRVRPPPPRRGVLGAQRRPARRRARPPAGRALQPLPAHAGDRARRRLRRAGQGVDRAWLRGPLLLGHGDLRRPVPHPHDCAMGQAGAGLPLRDARRGAQAGARRRPSRRAVPA